MLSILRVLWNERLNLEEQQAALRIIVGVIACCYLGYNIFEDGHLSENDWYTMAIAGVFFGCALVIIIWSMKVPGVYVSRRLLGIVLDNGATSLALYFNGIYGVPLFVVYLWVAFGNGFRFGRKYLAASAGCGLVGFSVVVVTADTPMLDPHVTLGLFVGLIVLPLYVSSLLKQLRRSLETAERANQAKSNFLATMSHEIRTPLNGVVGISDMLAKTELDERQKHYVELISRSSGWLMRVITDGLDFSKIEAGEFLLSRDPFDLRTTLLELCSLYMESPDKKEVQFSCQLDENLPRNLVGDQLRLVQVLSNLLSNAFKFTERGQIVLSAVPVTIDDTFASIRFSVTDTGIGVPLDKQGTIFQPFHQAELGTSKKYGGTGLGLAIAERIVRLMGGRLELQSTPNEGSSFSFTVVLPMAIAQGVSAGVAGGDTGRLQWHRQPLILLVEDHEINREVIVGHLEEMGCHVTLAVNGLEAIERLADQEFDLILMDCQMPVLDGYEATRRIRATEKKNVPIVALTAHVTVEDKRKCLDSGMNDYLGKPFRTVDLQAKLGQWLEPLLVKDAGTYVTTMSVPLAPVQVAVPIGGKSVRTICHDLKNLLFAIQGSAELSLVQRSDADIKKNTERIRGAVSKAVQLINDIPRDGRKS